MRTVLVAGIAGHLGRHVAGALRARGARVRGLGKRPRVARVPLRLVRLGARFVRLVHPRVADLALFYAAVMARDVVAPASGEATLGAYFRKRLGE